MLAIKPHSFIVDFGHSVASTWITFSCSVEESIVHLLSYFSQLSHIWYTIFPFASRNRFISIVKTNCPISFQLCCLYLLYSVWKSTCIVFRIAFGFAFGFLTTFPVFDSTFPNPFPFSCITIRTNMWLRFDVSIKVLFICQSMTPFQMWW